jgi:arylsulfatase A-like enzyme
VPERPNILLVQSDQHRYDCVGANGHPLLETPAMDRLASEGVSVPNAYTTIPLCVPARNSLLSGQWPTSHQCIANFDTEAPRPMRQDAPLFSEQLRDAGYRTGYVGRWHVDAERSPREYGFDDYVPEEEYADWRERQGIPDRPRENGWFGEPDPHIDPGESRVAWAADRAIELLGEYAQREDPFFLRWDTSEPHLPNVVPEPYASRYDPDDIEPWDSFDDDLADKPYVQRQQLRTWEVADWEWADWAPTVGRYLGEISLLDAQLGRLLEGLDEYGLAENTLVVYTADHGDMCGGHGMMDKHYVMYEDVTHVPLLVRWPAEMAADPNTDGFVSHSVDLAATFCDAAGAQRPPSFQGDSLVPMLRGESGGREDVFVQYHGNQLGLFTQRMVRDDRYKYVWNATARDEFYDLETDPTECDNRARDASLDAERHRLQERMIDWMESIDDPILNQWTRHQLADHATM